MNRNLIIGLIAVLILAGAGLFFIAGSNNTAPSITPPNVGDGGLIGQDSNDGTGEETQMVEGYQGNVLAGSTSPFIEFNQADYQKALSENKVIVLEFYANWCPVCRAEAPEIHAGFEELDSENVVGFRVNFKDSDTDEAEEALAEEFDVPYQYTKIILDNGVEVARYTEQWNRQDLLSAVNSVL